MPMPGGVDRERYAAYKAEVAFALAAYDRGDLEAAFVKLERAHVLGQPWFGPHSWTHWMMLKIAIKWRDGREIKGQLLRLAAGGILSLLGWAPVGNTGGADIPAMQRMPVPPDLRHLVAAEEGSD